MFTARFASIQLKGEVALVQAADGGQVNVKLTNVSMPYSYAVGRPWSDEVAQDSNISDTYVDIIGKVDDANTIKMYLVSNWGSNIGRRRGTLYSAFADAQRACRYGARQRRH